MTTSRRRVRILLVLPCLAFAALAGALPTAAGAAAGDLDGTFSGDGIATLPFTDGAFATSVVVQPDGKLVAGGHTGGSTGGDFALARFNADGSADSGFGTGGKVTQNVGTSAEFGVEVAVLDDGKILEAGTADIALDGRFGLARFNADGSPDTSFDSDGAVTTQWLGFSGLNVYGLAVDDKGTTDTTDDQYVVVGDADEDGTGTSRILVARYNADGSLDSGFGSGGKSIIALMDDVYAADVVVQSGKVVVGGYAHGSSEKFLLARLNADGIGFDGTFGPSGGGTHTHAVGTGTVYAYDLVEQPDGKLVMSGEADSSSVAVARYSADGVLDTTFGGDGIVIDAVDGLDWALAYGVAVQTDGSVVVGGTGYSMSGPAQMMAVRYAPDGTLDATFGGDGTVLTSAGEGAEAQGVAVQPDGKIVLAGGVDPTGGDHSLDLALARYGSEGDPAPADTTPPIVNLSAPADNSYTNSKRPAINGTAGNEPTDTYLAFELNKKVGSGWEGLHYWTVSKPTSGNSFSTQVPIDLADGTYHLRVYQGDDAGNHAPQDERTSRLFTVDSAAPVVSLSNPADNSKTTSKRPAISGNAGNASSDQNLTFELNRSTSSGWQHVKSWSHPKPTSSTSFSTQVPFDLSPGTYHLRAYQSDAAGNSNPQDSRSSRLFTVEQAHNPPKLAITSPGHLSATNQRQPTISGTSDTTGQVRVELHRWTGSGWAFFDNYYTHVSSGFWSVRPSYLLPEGTYSPLVYQTNSFGQTGTGTGGWWSVDTTPPAKPKITSPANNTKVGTQTPTFTGTADANAGTDKVYLQLQGYQNGKWVVLKTETLSGSGGGWSFKPTQYKFTAGYFAAFAYQYDAAGNVSFSDASTFQVDLNAKAPDNPGTNNNVCQKKLDWGPFHVEGTCLKREGLTWVSTAELTFNGLRLQPEGGNAKIILDPFNLRIAAQGRVKVVLGPAHFCVEDPTKIISDTCFYSYKAGPFVLYEGSFDWSWQGKVQLPDLPRFGLPTGRAANLPELPGLSGFNLPNLSIPDWGRVALPDFSAIKGPDIGKLSLPSLNAPQITLPEKYFGNFKFDLPRLSIGTSGAGNLLGFPFEGRVGLRFADQGIYIDAGLKLPSVLGGVTGDAVLFVGNSGNLLAKDLKFHASSFPMGPIGFRDLNITYSAANQLWEGSSWIDLPIPPTGLAVKAGAGFKNGQLMNAEAGFNQNFPIGTSGLFMYGGSVFFKTVPSRQVGGQINLGLGPAVKGVSAVRVDSGFKYQFSQPGWQSYFRIDGGVKVVNIPLASAWIQLYEGGDIDFGGRVGKDFGGGFVVEATVDGWIQKQKFNVDGTGKVHLGDWIKLDGNVTVSHIGVGGCATADGWFGKKTFGATYKWSGALNTMWDNCSVGAVKATKSTARAAGATQTVTVPGGQDAYVMGFRGAGGAPDVTLVGPNGERITTTGRSGLVDKRFLVIHVPQQNTTQVAIARPGAGRWTVEVEDGSVPLEQVLTAATLADPQIDARVTGRGDNRVLSYDVDAEPGDRVSFVEIGPGGAQSPIGEVGEGSGKLRFTPIAGPAGRRTIRAVVLNDGVARHTLDRATTFKASKPAIPAAPRKVRAKRKKGKQSDALLVRWAKVPGATSYRVTAVVSGRTKVIDTRRTRVKVPGLFARSKGIARVQALNALGRAGRAGKAVAKPPKPKHPPTKKRKKKRRR